jgi:hypothetical protein
VARAMNIPRAAVTATARCHRRVSPTPREPTVHRMYRVKIGERFQQAVNSIRVRSKFARVGAGVPCSCTSCARCSSDARYGRKTMSGIAISSAVSPP